ncbi:hypothetical protein MADA3029_650106 [Vibrio nigripulchritudo MADA3029]|nr:hypothetical protein VIBNIMADA3020_60076 [Vibrio nigripulchritudo MADA3020]CCN55557.1 hypothetical protein VIBNIMADA3021_790094 [Vibrio nigripulchritudo MADA3021]CCN60782.1 hypothetical protein MADA3029_650106 [Vibrio nigripulchritudo MADA3029]
MLCAGVEKLFRFCSSVHIKYWRSIGYERLVDIKTPLCFTLGARGSSSYRFDKVIALSKEAPFDQPFNGMSLLTLYR